MPEVAATNDQANRDEQKDPAPLAGAARSIVGVAVSEADVLRKWEYFVSVQVWPLTSQMDPEGWLSNFEAAEREYAVQLLNAFLYYSDSCTTPTLWSIRS